MATKIRKEQIRIDEFIQALASVDWTSDVLTASAAAINSKIQSEISFVAGAMLYRGAWSTAATDTIKKGYVYVYAGTSNGTIGTVTLEPGDMLIANQDSASITNDDHWTIVNVNITGAVTEANLREQLYGVLSNGNTDALTITNDTTNGKVKLTVIFPTISNGDASTGQYISALSINSTSGVITVTKDDLPNLGANTMVMDETPSGEINGTNTCFTSLNVAYSLTHVAMYINGVRQKKGTDYTASLSSGKIKFTLADGAYIPKTGDTVTVDYMARTAID